MAEQNAQQEPSMEDILASIRRILAEDGEEAKPAAAAPAATPAPPAAPKAAPPPPPPPPAPEPEPEPELEPEIDLMAEPAPAAEPEPAMDMDMNMDMDMEPVPMPEPEMPMPPPPPPPMPPMPPPMSQMTAVAAAFDDVLDLTADMRYEPEPVRPLGAGLVSNPVMTASTDALADLAKKLLQQRDIGVGSRDLTLEGLVRELLKPILKEWLDKNLPYLIERLVKREIDMMINRAERLED